MVRFAVIGTNFITDSLLEAGAECEGPWNGPKNMRENME